MKTFVTSDQIAGTAKSTVICCLYCNGREVLNFQLEVSENKAVIVFLHS